MAPGLTDHDRPGPPFPIFRPRRGARRRCGTRRACASRSPLTSGAAAGSTAWSSGSVVGVWNDGFIHAGNLAYMTVLAIFPFFVTGAALFSLFGEESDRNAAINAVLVALPPDVAEVIEPVAHTAVSSRSGWLLWVGGVVGLWTVGSLIETIRDILRRAYGTRPTQAFWKYRLLSSGLIVAAVFLVMLSLIAQVLIGADRRK